MVNEQCAAETFHVGMEVGARRWPYEGAHPACWREPLKGIVLAVDDLRAWAGTWYGHSQAAVDAHLAWCRRENLLDDAIPVLWISASGEPFVFWSEPSTLRPYAEDVARWKEARSSALQCLDSGRRAIEADLPCHATMKAAQQKDPKAKLWGLGVRTRLWRLDTEAEASNKATLSYD